eukprot:scaffold99339_cov66-Phaeocystis_antarctica.AAC.2
MEPACDRRPQRGPLCVVVQPLARAPAWRPLLRRRGIHLRRPRLDRAGPRLRPAGRTAHAAAAPRANVLLCAGCDG